MQHMTNDRFAGKTFVITGGGGGIGVATAIRLATEGGKVVLVDLDTRRLAAAIDSVKDAGGTRVVGVTADVTTTEGAAEYAAVAADLGDGNVYGLFNNAGTLGRPIPVDVVPLDVFDRTMNLNVRAALLGIQAVVPFMKDGSAIVNTGSASSLHAGAPNESAYVASKHALLGLTRSAALDLAPRGIRVNIVCPGPIDTPLLKSAADDLGVADPREWGSIIPLGRIGQPSDVASVVAFLLSADARHVTGAELRIDGGELS